MNYGYDLKPCPFCGQDVTIHREPLWHDGHGYKDCYAFVVKCDNIDCGCRVRMPQNDTIYRDEQTAIDNAVNAWNRRA